MIRIADMLKSAARSARSQYGYNSTEVSKITGASLRQLQWWDERKLLRPTEKYGHRRGYSLKDIEHIMLIIEFRKRGISIQRIRNLLAKVRRAPDQGREYIITDGHSVTCEPHAWVIAQLLRAKKPVMLISMTDIHAKMAGLPPSAQ